MLLLLHSDVAISSPKSNFCNLDIDIGFPNQVLAVLFLGRTYMISVKYLLMAYRKKNTSCRRSWQERIMPFFAACGVHESVC